MSKRLRLGFALIAVVMLFRGYAYAEEGNMTNINREAGNMKTLSVKWQRLVDDGQTCPRCGSTEEELGKAISSLEQSLAPLGIEVVLEKDELSVAEFKKDPLWSNRIWINGRLLEDWIGATSGQSPCCDVCGPSECRTVGIGGEVYESIPANLIVKAGLVAASGLIGPESDKNCRVDDASIKGPSGGCCPK